MKCHLTLNAVKIQKPFPTGETHLFLSEGAFAFGADILTVSHHHEVLCLSLLPVAGAGVWVQLVMLLDKVLPVAPSRLESQIQFSKLLE